MYRYTLYLIIPSLNSKTDFLMKLYRFLLTGDVIAFTTLRLFARATSKKYEYNVDAIPLLLYFGLPR